MNHLLTVKLTFIIERLLEIYIYISEGSKIKLHCIICSQQIQKQLFWTKVIESHESWRNVPLDIS